MAEKNAVEMENGQVVEFGAKQKMLKETVQDGSGIVTTLNFSNGRVLQFRTDNPEMIFRLACHGADQKLGDEISGIKEVEDCVLAVESLIGRLEKGEWNKERSSTGMAGTSVLIRALVEHSGKPVDAIKQYLSDKTQAQKLALRNNPAIKVIVDRLEVEKASNKPQIDTDALLAELV